MADFKGRDFKMHYVEQGDGIAVVFLHGLGLDHTMYAAQFEELPDTYRCIALDLRGHGHSESPDGPWSMDDVVADVVAFIDELEIAPVHLVGMSWGGMVALQVAIDRADLTRSLVVIDSSADAPSADVAGTYGRVMAGIEKDGLSDEIIELLMPFTFGERYRSESPDGVVAQHSRLHDMNPDAFIEGMRTLVTRRSLLGRLGEIRVPTLVIHGEEDASQPVAEAEKIVAGIAGAELVRISGAGHSTPIEAPDEVNAALARFFTRVD